MKKFYSFLAFLLALMCASPSAWGDIVFHDNGTSNYGDNLSLHSWGTEDKSAPMIQVADNNATLHCIVYPTENSNFQFFKTGSSESGNYTVTLNYSSSKNGYLYRSGSWTGSNRDCEEFSDYGFKVILGGISYAMELQANNTYEANVNVTSNSMTFKLEDVKNWFKFRGTSTITDANMNSSLTYDTSSTTSSVTLTTGYYKVIFDPTNATATSRLRFEATSAPTAPDMYLYSNASGWDLTSGTVQTSVEGDVYTYNNVQLVNDKFYTFSTKVGTSASDWSTIGQDRYGPDTDKTAISSLTYSGSVSKADNCWQYTGTTGTANITLDMDNMTLTIQPAVVVTYTLASVTLKKNGEVVAANILGDENEYSVNGAKTTDQFLIVANYTGSDASTKTETYYTTINTATNRDLVKSASGTDATTFGHDVYTGSIYVTESAGVFTLNFVDGFLFNTIENVTFYNADQNSSWVSPMTYQSSYGATLKLAATWKDGSKTWYSASSAISAAGDVEITDAADADASTISVNAGVSTATITANYTDYAVSKLTVSDVTTNINSAQFCTSSNWETKYDGTPEGDVLTFKFKPSTGGTIYASIYYDGKYYGCNLGKVGSTYVALTDSSATTPGYGQDNQQFTMSGLNTEKYYILSLKQVDGVFQAKVDEEEVEITGVNMPLSKSDFKDGKAHYFLVGSRMGDFHLQPEWELVQQADGTYAIDGGRFVFPSYYGIAKVTSYNDYVHQRYEYFSVAGAETTRAAGVATASLSSLASQGTMQGYVTYGETRFSDSNSAKIKLDAVATDKGESSRGAWVGNIAITVDASGNPTQVNFTEIADSNFDELTFSLVGANIRNAKFYTAWKADTSNPRTPLQYTDAGGVGGATNCPANWGWQEAWIQYDATGKPYVDGNNEFIYHTAFNRSWLEDKEVVFEYTEGAKQMMFTSPSITFVKSTKLDDLDSDNYREFYQCRESNKTIGANGANGIIKGGSGDTEYCYKEVLLEADGETVVTGGLTIDGDWTCYVVRDAWISDQFKIWTGFGGSRIDSEPLSYRSDSSVKNNRWNGLNIGLDKADITLYRGDIQATAETEFKLYRSSQKGSPSDFKLNELKYYNRIILWFSGDREKGQVIQFISELDAPQILATVTGTTVSYEWSINTTEDTKTREITKSVVTRYRVTSEGEEFSDSWTTPYDAGTTIATINDSNPSGSQENMVAGTYCYRVEVTYANGTVKTARSNNVIVYSSSNNINPEPLAIQLLHLNALKADNTLGQSTTNKNLYLTYRSSSDADYYVIEKSGTTIESITKVNATTAKNFIANCPEQYVWTSDFYLRGLNYTDFLRTLQRQQDNGFIDAGLNLENIDVTITVDEQGNDNQINLTKAANTYTVGGVQYIGGIMARNGNLGVGKVVFTMNYYNDGKDFNVNTSNTSGFRPVVPGPLGGTYFYDYVENTRANADLSKYKDWLKVNVQSQLQAAKPTVPVYVRKADMNESMPRILNCVFCFTRPNVTDAILDYYDIEYTISVTNQESVDLNGASGVYTDKYQSNNQASVNETGNYQLMLKNVHPTPDVYPIFEITQTKYSVTSKKPDTSYEDEVASYGKKVKVAGRTSSSKTDINHAEVSFDPVFGSLQNGSGTYDVMYKYHKELKNFDYIHDPKIAHYPGDVTPAAIKATPSFYLVETKVDEEVRTYEFLALHEEGHLPATPVVNETPHSGITGFIEGDKDPLRGVFVGKGFSSNPNTVGLTYAVTPIYFFYHDPEGTGLGEKDSEITWLQKVGAAASVRHKSNSSAVDQGLISFTPVLPDWGTTLDGSNVTDLTSNDSFVAVEGGVLTQAVSNSAVTGVENISVDAEDCEVEYYNLQGIRVANPEPGNVYVVRRGATASKIRY